MPEFTGQRDLRAYARVLWRWKFLFLAFLIAAPLAAYLLERGKPSIYQSSALVGVSQTTVDTSVLNGTSSFSTSNVIAIAELVKTSPVADVAATFIHPRPNPAQISSEVTATGDPNTNFLTITAQDTSPTRAAEIANAFAKAIGLNRQQAAISQLDNSISGIETQIRHLHHGNPARAALVQQLTQLKAAKGTQGGEAALLQPAAPNYSPVGPHLRRTVELGFVIGLLLAFGAVVLAESADRRMRTPDDLEGMTELPLLATIPATAFGEHQELSPVDEESFQMLRTALTYFNIDQALRSILITSAAEKEGKTTVASRLAEAAARAGSRVILVDADLRRAGASHRFGADDRGGLGPVLAGQGSAQAALQEVPLPGESLGTLRVLPSGQLPPNPSALMSSARMQEVLRTLENDADLVVIDSPPALAVSDSVPLMQAVSGVVMVARLNQSDRATVKRLQSIVESAHGNLLGIVATGVASGLGYRQYTRSYYSPHERSKVGKRRFGRRSRTQQSTPGLMVQPTDRPVSSRSD